MEQKEYDFRFQCWAALVKKLSRKGRRLGEAEITLLPARPSSHECIVEGSVPDASPGTLSRLKKPNY